MVTLGRIARARGRDFEDFWLEAVRPGEPPITTRKLGPNGEMDDIPVGAVIWPSDTADRAVEQAATEAMKEAWRRAYNREPETPGDRAIKGLYGLLIEQDTGGIEAGSDVPLAASL
jgi:hypothetical protein